MEDEITSLFRDYAHSDPEILGGTPVIRGTRIPLEVFSARLMAAHNAEVERIIGEDEPEIVAGSNMYTAMERNHLRAEQRRRAYAQWAIERIEPVNLDKKETPTPNPGTKEAQEQGCKCPVLDNNYGRGVPQGEGKPNAYWRIGSCPLHGFED